MIRSVIFTHNNASNMRIKRK